MLLGLTAAFALSQSPRTIATIMATPLQAEFGLRAPALGLFAGACHFAFGGMQLFMGMGMGIDLHGVRRTVLAAFALAIAGAALSALAPSFGVLVWGRVLIAVGCAPAFLVCTVFITRHFLPERFAAISGLTRGFGGIGMLITGTPLAWLIQATSWRRGFVMAGSFVGAGLGRCLARGALPAVACCARWHRAARVAVASRGQIWRVVAAAAHLG